MASLITLTVNGSPTQTELPNSGEKKEFRAGDGGSGQSLELECRASTTGEAAEADTRDCSLSGGMMDEPYKFRAKDLIGDPSNPKGLEISTQRYVPRVKIGGRGGLGGSSGGSAGASESTPGEPLSNDQCLARAGYTEAQIRDMNEHHSGAYMNEQGDICRAEFGDTTTDGSGAKSKSSPGRAYEMMVEGAATFYPIDNLGLSGGLAGGYASDGAGNKGFVAEGSLRVSGNMFGGRVEPYIEGSVGNVPGTTDMRAGVTGGVEVHFGGKTGDRYNVGLYGSSAAGGVVGARGGVTFHLDSAEVRERSTVIALAAAKQGFSELKGAKRELEIWVAEKDSELVALKTIKKPTTNDKAAIADLTSRIATAMGLLEFILIGDTIIGTAERSITHGHNLTTQRAELDPIVANMKIAHDFMLAEIEKTGDETVGYAIATVGSDFTAKGTPPRLIDKDAFDRVINIAKERIRAFENASGQVSALPSRDYGLAEKRIDASYGLMNRLFNLKKSTELMKGVNGSGAAAGAKDSLILSTQNNALQALTDAERECERYMDFTVVSADQSLQFKLDLGTRRQELFSVVAEGSVKRLELTKKIFTERSKLIAKGDDKKSEVVAFRAELKRLDAKIKAARGELAKHKAPIKKDETAEGRKKALLAFKTKTEGDIGAVERTYKAATEEVAPSAPTPPPAPVAAPTSPVAVTPPPVETVAPLAERFNANLSAALDAIFQEGNRGNRWDAPVVTLFQMEEEVRKQKLTNGVKAIDLVRGKLLPFMINYSTAIQKVGTEYRVFPGSTIRLEEIERTAADLQSQFRSIGLPAFSDKIESIGKIKEAILEAGAKVQLGKIAAAGAAMNAEIVELEACDAQLRTLQGSVIDDTDGNLQTEASLDRYIEQSRGIINGKTKITAAAKGKKLAELPKHKEVYKALVAIYRDSNPITKRQKLEALRSYVEEANFIPNGTQYLSKIADLIRKIPAAAPAPVAPPVPPATTTRAAPPPPPPSGAVPLTSPLPSAKAPAGAATKASSTHVAEESRGLQVKTAVLIGQFNLALAEAMDAMFAGKESGPALAALAEKEKTLRQRERENPEVGKALTAYNIVKYTFATFMNGYYQIIRMDENGPSVNQGSAMMIDSYSEEGNRILDLFNRSAYPAFIERRGKMKAIVEVISKASTRLEAQKKRP